MDISNLPCPNGLWSHGTFNVLNVLKNQTEINVQLGLEYWKLVLFFVHPVAAAVRKYFRTMRTPSVSQDTY
jgi:hypothetical protein